MTSPIQPGPDRPTLLAFAGVVLCGGLNTIAVRATVLELDPEWGAAIRASRMSIWLEVPLWKDGKLLGSISGWRTEPRPFSDKEVRLLRNFADSFGFKAHYALQVKVDQALFGTPIPTVWLQRHYYHPPAATFHDYVAWIVYLTHFMAMLVPALLLARMLGRLLQPALGGAAARRDAELRIVPGVNGVLRTALRLERLWLRVAPLPFGTSLLAIARRPASAATS